MKKRVFLMVLMLSVVLCLVCTSAFAVDGDDFSGGWEDAVHGVYNIVIEDGFADKVEVIPMTAKGEVISASTERVEGKTAKFYKDAEKFEITYSAAETGVYYMVYILSEDAAPTAGNIVGLDQVTAQSSDISVTLYPDSLETGKTYYVYIYGGDGAVASKAASFSCGKADTASVLLGDVDGDGEIHANDATMVLKHIAELIQLSDSQKLAADVDGDGEIHANDATMILKYIAELITEF